MGTDYSFYVKTIETHARAFFKVIIFSIGSVGDHSYCALVGPGTNFYLGQKLYSAKLLPMNSKVFSPIVKLKHYYLKKHLK